jgi:hypothetical protein
MICGTRVPKIAVAIEPRRRECAWSDPHGGLGTTHDARTTPARIEAHMPLTTDALLDNARAATGLDDFGDPSFRDGLEVLTESLTHEAALNPIGEMAHQFTLGSLLNERLRVLDGHRRHPAIGRQALGGPSF